MKKIGNYLINLFRERVKRRHFIMGTLLLIILTLTITGIAGSLLPTDSIFFEIFSWIIFGASFFLFISLLVRRLHDIGLSGLYAFIFFMPPIGLSLIMTEGGGVNKYGDPPQEEINLLDDVAGCPIFKRPIFKIDLRPKGKMRAVVVAIIILSFFLIVSFIILDNK